MASIKAILSAIAVVLAFMAPGAIAGGGNVAPWPVKQYAQCKSPLCTFARPAYCTTPSCSVCAECVPCGLYGSQVCTGEIGKAQDCLNNLQAFNVGSSTKVCTCVAPSTLDPLNANTCI